LVQKVYPLEEKNEEKPPKKAGNAVDAAQTPQPAQNDEELG